VEANALANFVGQILSQLRAEAAEAAATGAAADVPVEADPMVQQIRCARGGGCLGRRGGAKAALRPASVPLAPPAPWQAPASALAPRLAPSIPVPIASPSHPAPRSATPEAAEQLQAASRRLAEEMRDKGTRMGKPVPQMVKVPDPSIQETSSALVAWRQQVALVEGAAALVAAELVWQEQERQQQRAPRQAGGAA
jgi:hypothetical protein